MVRACFLILFLITSIILNGQILRYEGVLNDPAVDPDFGKGSEAITASIKQNLNNLNLYEYAHALVELYPLIEKGDIAAQEWKKFIDSMEWEVKGHYADTLLPYWAVDYLGLIPLQAQFFVATLDRNEKLNRQYPNAYRILRENTSIMKGLEYRPEDYDSLLVFSEVVGETNFWYFFQLEDCNFITDVIQKDENLVKWVESVTSSMDLTSTSKVPYFLQKRKWQSIQRRLSDSNNSFCILISKYMNNRSIGIADNEEDYFKSFEREGLNWRKMKIF